MGGPGDAAYAYHVLSTHYDFNDIYYLHYNTNIPEVDAYANSTNFSWAITHWLADKAYSNNDTDDVMFIYVIAHGSGIAHRPPNGNPVWEDNLTLYDGQYDGNLDERYDTLYEIREANVVNKWNISENVDVNGDQVIKGWVGIDEVVKFHDPGDTMTDDELASNLTTLDGKYKTLIFATQQCMGGGLIDDLSGPNRIIMTAIDKTHLATADVGDDSLSEWSAAFFDALHGEDTSYNAGTGKLIHEGTAVDADYNDDGHISMLEIFNYTSACMESIGNLLDYSQTVWLDDNNNRLPTYANETDLGNACDNGSLAANTWFPRRHYNLTVKTRKTSGHEISGVKMWIDGSLEYSPLIAYDVTAETHSITVESTIYVDGYEYRFSFLEDSSTSNPRMLHIHDNKTITAYYHIQAGGCPFVYVWNGSDYVDYGVIDIHDVENDVVREVHVQAEDVSVAGHKVKFTLREGWEGLNYSHSLIDQVKLYAVDSEGNRLLCPLIKAEHSEQGKVLFKLLFSDDYRTDTYLMDTIDLTFIMPYPAETIENFTFIIEGHNPLKL